MEGLRYAGRVFRKQSPFTEVLSTQEPHKTSHHLGSKAGVRAAEQVSASLKSPLIDSYRRENELMSVMIERSGSDRSGEHRISSEPPEAQEATKRAYARTLPAAHQWSRCPASAMEAAVMQLPDSPRAGVKSGSGTSQFSTRPSARRIKISSFR